MIEPMISSDVLSPHCILFSPRYGSECDSSTLLNGRASVGPETNAPNTLVGDDCDGSAGTYRSDESLEKIIVKSKDGNTMTEGSEVEVIATVYAWDTGSSDSADFYYASDASDPNWQFIETLVPPGGGQQDLVVSYTLPAGENQAVRVNFRYNGAAGPCSGGNWDDADDLVFRVIEDNVPTGSPIPEPTASPTDSPSSSPSEIPTGSPSFSPSKIPTGSPTNFPSGIPSDSPSASPSDKNPTTSPTPGPSDAPSTSASPTQSPSLVPSSSPSASPSKDPTNSPSVSPSFSPTTSPSQYPTKNPSSMPSFSPSDSPSGLPTSTPSTSHAPSPLPTSTPTQAPTQFPTNKPTKGNKNTKKRRMAMTRSRASAPL